MYLLCFKLPILDCWIIYCILTLKYIFFLSIQLVSSRKGHRILLRMVQGLFWVMVFAVRQKVRMFSWCNKNEIKAPLTGHTICRPNLVLLGTLQFLEDEKAEIVTFASPGFHIVCYFHFDRYYASKDEPSQGYLLQWYCNILLRNRSLWLVWKNVCSIHCPSILETLQIQILCKLKFKNWNLNTL